MTHILFPREWRRGARQPCWLTGSVSVCHSPSTHPHQHWLCSLRWSQGQKAAQHNKNHTHTHTQTPVFYAKRLHSIKGAFKMSDSSHPQLFFSKHPCYSGKTSESCQPLLIYSKQILNWPSAQGKRMKEMSCKQFSKVNLTSASKGTIRNILVAVSPHWVR